MLDDTENNKNIRTAGQCFKLLDWPNRAVSKASDNYTDIVYIGTLLHYDSLLAHTLINTGYKSIRYKAVLSFSQANNLWKEWEDIYTDLSNDSYVEGAKVPFEARKAEMLRETEILQGEKLSYYDLVEMRINEGEASFSSEGQNEPINPDDCLLQEEWPGYYNKAEMDFKDHNFVFYGFADPSLGKTRHSDFSVITTLAKYKGMGYMYVFDADTERHHPDRIISDVLEKERRVRRDYGREYKEFGCGAVQFQWSLEEELVKASAKAGLYLPVGEVSQTAGKTLRIQTTQPDIKNKYIRSNRHRKRLLEQLVQFPIGAYDDGPDALERYRALVKKIRKFKIIPGESLI